MTKILKMPKRPSSNYEGHHRRQFFSFSNESTTQTIIKLIQEASSVNLNLKSIVE